jgi:hypothetical protein
VFATDDVRHSQRKNDAAHAAEPVFCSERARRSSGYGPKRPGLQEICDVRFKHLEKQTIFA